MKYKTLIQAINFFYKCADSIAPTDPAEIELPIAPGTPGAPGVPGKPTTPIAAPPGTPVVPESPVVPTTTQQNFAMPQSNKPNVVYRDRYKGATGEERENLIRAEAEKKGFTLVEHKRTPIDYASVNNALKNVIKTEYPDLDQQIIDMMAEVVSGQVGIETGFKSCHNLNTGNFHALPNDKNKYWDGKVSVWHDPQIDKQGNPYTNLDTFWRAYDKLENGLGDQFLLIKKRFPKAIEYAKAGDIEGFATELGTRGYYSRYKINDYIKGMKSIIKRNKKPV
ncbi:MAG: hypothetical protein ACOYLO_00730 [Ferruginibacter sp.]